MATVQAPADWLVNFTKRNPGSLYPSYAVKINPTGYEIMAIYLTLLGIVATIGNTTVLIVVIKYGTFKKRAINLLVVNMAFSDLCISFTGYPLTTISSYAGRWIFGYGVCKFNGVAVFALSCSTMTTHAALAAYRYIYVCQHNLRPKLSGPVTRYLILFIWCHAFFWALTPLIGWSMYDYEPFGTSCSIDWVTRTINNYSFMLLTTLANYVIPLVIMVFCYWGIIRKSKKVDPLRVEENDQRIRIVTNIQRLEAKIDNHVTRMCILMTVGFFIAWTPYAVESLWASHHAVKPVTTTLPTMLAKSSCAMNPIIYMAASSTFRKDIIKLFRGERQDTSISGSPGNAENTAAPPARGEYFVRDTVGPDSGVSSSVYFDNKKQIYIGNVPRETIEKENSMMKRIPNTISVQFASIQVNSDDIDARSQPGTSSTGSKDPNARSDRARVYQPNKQSDGSSVAKDVGPTTESPIFN